MVSWAAPYGDCGDAYALAVDQLGNAYVAGSNADCSLPIIDHDYTVVKYDSNGNVSWIARNFNAGEDDYPTDIAVDGFGNVYITGVNCNSLYDPNDPSDCYDFKNVTLKYDANGVKLWSAQYYTGIHDSLAALSVNDAGNIYMSTGSCRDNDSCTFFDLATLKYTHDATSRPTQRLRYVFM